MKTHKIQTVLLLFDVTTLKNLQGSRKITEEYHPAGYAGNINRVKEIRRREKGGLKLTDNRIM